jgi:hypothetical protein
MLFDVDGINVEIIQDPVNQALMKFNAWRGANVVQRIVRLDLTESKEKVNNLINKIVNELCAEIEALERKAFEEQA